MKKEGGYFENDIKIKYFINTPSINKIDTNIDFTKSSSNYYEIFWQSYGSAKLRIKNKIVDLKQNEMILIKPKVEYDLFLDSNESYKSIIFDIHPSFFEIYNDEKDLFRFFYDKEKENTIIDLSKPDTQNLVNAISLLDEALFKQYGRTYIKPRVMTLMTEISIYYDDKYGNKIPVTDSMAVKVMDYINKYYHQSISEETIRNTYYISIPTIRKIVYNWTGMTYKNYIIYLRMKDAKKMIKENFVTDLGQVAMMCGYTNYSSFYRAYQKYYGVSPKSDKDKNSIKWPLT